MYLKQSTAAQIRSIGPFVDDTDFKTLENALSIANTDILLKKNGGASAAKNSGGATADGSGGMYHLTFDATDTATVGELMGSVKVAGALVVPFKFFVLEEAVYDALFAASATGMLPANVIQLLGTAWLTPGTAGTPDVNAKQWAGQAIPTPAQTGVPKVDLMYILGTLLTETAGQIAAAFRTFFNVSSPVATAQGVNQTGDSFARIGANGASLTALATAAQINGLAVNTRANLNVPVEIELPDSSTQVYKIRLHLFDVEGNMEAPDSTPTIALTNAAGTDRSSRLSVASNPSTGVYTWDYTATAGDAEEQLVWVFTVVEGGATRVYPATSYVVEESAYRFSSTDRATLNAAATQTSVNDIPTNAEFEARTLAAASYATAANQTTIIADTNELQTDWANGGRLDVILDARASQASVDAVDDLVDTEVAAIKAVVDAIKVITDALGATAAANLAKSCSNAGVVSFTAATGTLSTTQATTNLSEATNDHYIGRVIIWLTGVLAGQATDVTDYTGSGGLLTFTALTEAPSNGDTGILV